MQGFIIDIKKSRDDDLIVLILGETHLYSTYRFYGARHSTINIAYKIDFELESNYKSTIPRLKDVLHISFPWIFDTEKLYLWQRFVKLFYSHLKDVEELDPFYMNLLNSLISIMVKQNPKRAIIQAYLQLLEFEGRLHSDYMCLLCEVEINTEVSLVRSFLPVHAKCTYAKKFAFYKIKELFEEKSLISFTDEEVDYLFDILLQGL
ncbi:MAG: recombination protein RecO [Campylobacterales bacterium]|nr:recombination protein RecO [Campylobacterales bacterium]